MDCWVVHNSYTGEDYIFTERDKLVFFLGEWAVNEQESGGDLKEAFSEVYLFKKELNPEFN